MLKEDEGGKGGVEEVEWKRSGGKKCWGGERLEEYYKCKTVP